MEVFERDNYCFACGADNPIGLKMKVDFFPDGAKTTVIPKKEYQGWSNVIHGGIIATLLDEIMAHAVFNHVGDAVTTSFSMTLRHKLEVGHKVEVIGRIKERKRRAVLAEAEIRSADNGTVIARAESKFMLFRPVSGTNAKESRSAET